MQGYQDYKYSVSSERRGQHIGRWKVVPVGAGEQQERLKVDPAKRSTDTSEQNGRVWGNTT